jgi:hypothetical protein
MFAQRTPLYAQLETKRASKVLVFITGDRPELGIQIAGDCYDHFVNHLDRIGVVPKISLFLYTRGGLTSAAWSIVNLIRQFCDEFEIIVPSRAHSAGTLMTLGAQKIVMTKQATLGPIDPSVNTPLNPQQPGPNPARRVPVGVEAIKGFIELAKEEIGVKGQAELAAVFSGLAANVHPLVLGEVYRARSQIKMLATKLLSGHITDGAKRKKIIDFLCSESGSHDYTIHRREAKQELGLNVEKPDDALYALIKGIYDDIERELQLTTRFDQSILLGPAPTATYSLTRGLLESIGGGSTAFLSEGTLTRMQGLVNNVPQSTIHDQRTFEGWRHHAI